MAAPVSPLLLSRLRMFLHVYEQDNPAKQLATDQNPLFKTKMFSPKAACTCACRALSHHLAKVGTRGSPTNQLQTPAHLRRCSLET